MGPPNAQPTPPPIHLPKELKDRFLEKKSGKFVINANYGAKV
jgi:hypothetical protein